MAAYSSTVPETACSRSHAIVWVFLLRGGGKDRESVAHGRDSAARIWRRNSS